MQFRNLIFFIGLGVFDFEKKQENMMECFMGGKY